MGHAIPAFSANDHNGLSRNAKKSLRRAFLVLDISSTSRRARKGAPACPAWGWVAPRTVGRLDFSHPISHRTPHYRVGKMMRLDDWSPAAKIAEFPDETKRHDTGQDGPQRFRKPLLYPAELREHADRDAAQMGALRTRQSANRSLRPTPRRHPSTAPAPSPRKPRRLRAYSTKCARPLPGTASGLLPRRRFASWRRQSCR